MINIGTLLATLKIKDQLTPALAKAQQSLKNAGPKMKAVGRSMATSVTLPLVAAGAAAIKFAVDMNKSMANVATLIPDSTERVLELKKSVQDLAIETGKSTADLADGLYQVVSAFGDSADTAKILELNAKAAGAGLATTSDAIALTSAVTKGYGDTSFEAMQKASDLAFTTVKLGQTTFPELAASIGRVVPLTAELGVSQEELFGVMATATGVVGSASEVSTKLMGVMQALMAPTDNMKEVFKHLGVETGKAAIEQHGLQGVLDATIKVSEDAGVELQKYIGSIEGQTLALALAGAQSDNLTEKTGKMGVAVGATAEAWGEQTEGVNAAGHAWNQLSSSSTVLLQQLGDELIPTFTNVVASIASSVKWFSALSPTVKKVIVAVAGLTAAIGPVLIVLGFMATALAAVSLPVVAVVAGIALFIGALIKWRKGITDFIQKGINKFLESLDAWKVLLGKMTKAEAAAAKAQRELEAEVEAFVPVVEEVTEVLEEHVDALDEGTTGTLQLDDATKALNERIADQVRAWRMGGIPAMKDALAAYKKFGTGVDTLSTDQLQSFADTLEDGIETYKRHGEAIPHEATLAWMEALDELRLRAGDATEAFVALHGETVKPWFKPIHQLSLEEATAGFEKLDEEVVEFTGDVDQFSNRLDNLARIFEQLATISGDTFGGIAKWLGTVVASMQLATESAEMLNEGITEIGDEDSVDGFMNLTTGILGVVAAMDAATASGTRFQKSISGMAVGAQAGSVFGPIGTAIGAGLGFAIGFFRKGVDEAEKAGREMAFAFEDAVIASLNAAQLAEAGGNRVRQSWIGVRDAYELTGRSAEEAAAQVALLWEMSKRGPEAVQYVIDSIQTVMDQAAEIRRLTDEATQGLVNLTEEGKRTGELLPQHLEPYLATLLELGEITEADMLALMELAEQAQYDWRAVEEAAKRYGVEVEFLGEQFRTAQLGEQAAQVAADWDLMAVKGAKANRIARRMAKTVQGLIDDYAAAGIAIPAALQPVIEKQISMGLLTDENGEKITDVSQLSFAAPLVTQFDKLIEAIERLIAKLIGDDGVTAAIETVNDTQLDDRTMTVNVQYDDQGWDPSYDDPMDQRHGTGGRFVDFGTGTPAILHGKERVMTEAEGKREAAELGGVEQRLSSIEQLLRDQPRAFGVAVSDSLTLMN